MANFSTHLNFGIVGSGLAASSLLIIDAFTPTQLLLLWGVGSIGGMLPDIDADDSKAIKVLFNLFAAFLACLSILYLMNEVAIVSLWLIAAAVFCFIRYVVIYIFEFFSVHRGSVHSVLCVAMCGLIAVCLAHHLGFTHLMCWAMGCFLSGGMLIHLLLDELYSVDITNARIKRSFGTALKLAEFKSPIASSLQFVAIIILLFFTPPLSDALNTIQQMPHSVSQFQFWPDWILARW